MAQVHSKKIKQIYDKVITDKNQIEKLEEIKIKTFSINFSKERKDYNIDWQILSYSTASSLIELINFPEDFIANLNVLCIFRTSDGLIDNQLYQDYNPKYNYIIREKENKYEVMVYVTSVSPTPNFYVEYKIIITSINPKDFYEVRTRKK